MKNIQSSHPFANDLRGAISAALLSLTLTVIPMNPAQGKPELSLNVAVSPQTRQPFVPLFLTRLEVPALRFGIQESSVMFELAHWFDSRGGVQIFRLGPTLGASFRLSNLQARFVGYVFSYLVQGRGYPQGDERGFSQRLIGQLRFAMPWFWVDFEVSYSAHYRYWWVGFGVRF